MSLLINILIPLASVALIIVLIMRAGLGRKSASGDQNGAIQTPSQAAPAPAPAAAPAAAGSGGSDERKTPWESQNIAVLVVVFVLVLGLIGFGVKSCADSQPKASVVSHAPAETSARRTGPATSGVSTGWVSFAAPVSTWYTISSEPGYDVEICDPVADPNCTDPAMKGYRARCIDMVGAEKDWTESGCRNFLRFMVQAEGQEPLPLVWRYIPRN
jgi:hypothetical protein